MTPRTLVKICGITREADAEAALELGADYIGINLFAKSPRSVSEARARELLRVIPEGKRVMVDVATGTDQLPRYRDMGFDAFQIHFDLEISMATLAGWSGLVGADCFWAAPRIPPEEKSFPQIILEFSETLLLDAYSKSAFGGTGVAGSNWQRYIDCSVLYQHKTWILAGGLNPSNVVEALHSTHAPFVDVASGVEAEPGVKSRELLNLFFKNLNTYDNERRPS
jgi:phosphoribosylanthranilate isomerase